LCCEITRPILYKYGKQELQIEIESTSTKEDIIGVILDDVAKNKTHKEHLYNFVNKVQEWGRQHIFLFRSLPEIRADFKKLNFESLQKILIKEEIDLRLNESRPLFMPGKNGFELFKVTLDEGKRLSLIWAERRVFYSRYEGEDYIDKDSGLEYRAWKSHQSRGILIFDWNLLTGQMMVRVSQAENKSTYDNGRRHVLQSIESILKIPAKSWSKLDIRKCIANIKDSGEVSTKKFNQETQSGGKQSLQSRDKKHGIEVDRELLDASKAMKNKYASTYGNFFWKVDDDEGLEKEVHTTIDSKSNSLLVYGIQTEDRVRYILGRIIHHTR
jgi:hypothetical protein